MQYLITLQKSDKVSKLKEQLRYSIGRPVGDIILAEALDNHISRILVSICRCMVNSAVKPHSCVEIALVVLFF